MLVVLRFLAMDLKGISLKLREHGKILGPVP